MKNMEFFEAIARLRVAVSYGDVLLLPGHSSVAPEGVNVRSLFSRNVPLNCPIVSAAMDTVTESRMAIAMAEFGGLGVIHRKLKPEAQAAEVARVKWWRNGFISAPKKILAGQTVEEVLNWREAKGYHFHSFPVLNTDGKVVGLMTKTRFERCEDRNAKIADVMAKTFLSCCEEKEVDFAYAKLSPTDDDILVVLNKDGTLAGIWTFDDAYRIKKEGSSKFNTDKNGHLRVAAAIGTGEDALARAELLIKARVDAVVIDTGHGDTEAALWTLKQFKKKWSNPDIVVGNVATGSAAKLLVDNGADGIKVGVGPGSICTTRIVTGCGVPQVTAIHNASMCGVPVCGDGGIEYSGDIAKAIGAGAHSVMLGKLLTEAEEAPGEIKILQGVKYKFYRGMGALSSMLESKEACNRYQQKPEVGRDKLVPEGIEGWVVFDGKPVAGLLFQYEGGLRAGMGLVGAGTIDEMREKADFCQQTAAGSAESHPHGLMMVTAAPNYQERSK